LTTMALIRLRGKMMAEHLITAATQFVIEHHGEQKYGRKPYYSHLMDVVGALKRFVDWDELEQELIDAAWLHDVVEDTDVSSDDVFRTFGTRVGALVKAVTNEQGANRKERHLKTYPKIRDTYRAIVLKLADRIANVENCVSRDRFGRPPKGLFWMYVKDHDFFVEQLRGRCSGEDETTEMMWRYLDELMIEGKQKDLKIKTQRQSNEKERDLARRQARTEKEMAWRGEVE